MKAILTLIYRDLLLQPRKRFFRWKRVAFVLLVFTILATVIFNRSSYADNSTLGLQTVISFTIIVAIAITFMAPATAALLISKENEQGTLGLLLLTDLSPWRIVTGKFFLQVLLSLLTYLSCLPLLIISIGLGGISAKQVLAVVSILLSLILFGGAVGLLASLSVKSKNAQGNAVGLMLLFIIVGSIGYSLGNNLPSRSVGLEWMASLSPVAALTCALSDKTIHYSFANALFNSILVFPLLGITAMLLPQSHIRSQSTRWSLRFKQMVQRKFRKRTDSSAITGNAIAWRDYHKIYGGSTGSWVKGIVCLVAIMILTIVILKTSFSEDHKRIFFQIQAFSFSTMMLCTFLTAINGATHAFAREKEQKTLELLLLTSLGDWDILWGKILAIGKNVFPFILIGSISGLLSLFVIPRINGEGVVVVIVGIIWATGYLAMVVSIGLYFSLHCKTMSNTQGYTLLTLLLWHMTITPLGFTVSSMAPTVSWALWGIGYLVAAGWLLSATANNLRRYC